MRKDSPAATCGVSYRHPVSPGRWIDGDLAGTIDSSL